MKRSIMFMVLLGIAALLPAAAQDVAEGQCIAYQSNTNGLYASHATLPFGTHLVVTNLNTRRQVTVRVGGRLRPGDRFIVELSPAAASAIGLMQGDIANVRVERVSNKPKTSAQAPVKVARKVSTTFYAFRLDEGDDEYYAYSNTLAPGTRVLVVNPSNNRQTLLEIRGRIEDWPGGEMMELSDLAAETLDIRSRGTVDVSPQ